MYHVSAPVTSLALVRLARLVRDWGRAWVRDSSAAVVAFAGLHGEALLFGGKANPVVGAGGVGAIRRIAQTVLVPQVLIDLVVHLGQGLFLRNLEETAAGLARDMFQHLF